MKTLRQGAEEYLEYRSRLGFKLRFDKLVLPQFVFFMESKGTKHITIELALAFAKINPSTTSMAHARRLGVIRRFALYWSAVDRKSEVPPKNLIPWKYQRKSPYIYTDDEIVKLLECSDGGLHSSSFEQYTHSVLFGLLSVTGMRVTEALMLDCKDIDVFSGIITVRKSKFQKSRYLPIHSSTAEVLRKFSDYRNHYFPRLETSRFFIDRNGKALKRTNVGNVFRKRLIKLNLIKPDGYHNPTMMALRHTFSVKVLLRWYKQGVSSIDHYIPLLSTYLGHVMPTNTYWYLTATPELLEFVLARCKMHKRRTQP